MADAVKKKKKMKRTIYLTDTTWQLLSFHATINHRSISDQLEYMLASQLIGSSPQMLQPQSDKDELALCEKQAGLLSAL